MNAVRSYRFNQSPSFAPVSTLPFLGTAIGGIEGPFQGPLTEADVYLEDTPSITIIHTVNNDNSTWFPVERSFVDGKPVWKALANDLSLVEQGAMRLLNK